MAVQDIIKNISERVSNAATINTVFGEARVLTNRAIIPIAVVAGGFGGGGGEGKMPSDEKEGISEGSGGGGGGGFIVRPLAVLEVTEQNTRLIPILDLTKIILAGLGIVAGGCIMMAKARHNNSR